MDRDLIVKLSGGLVLSPKFASRMRTWCNYFRLTLKLDTPCGNLAVYYQYIISTRLTDTSSSLGCERCIRTGQFVCSLTTGCFVWRSDGCEQQRAPQHKSELDSVPWRVKWRSGGSSPPHTHAHPHAPTPPWAKAGDLGSQCSTYLYFWPHI